MVHGAMRKHWLPTRLRHNRIEKSSTRTRSACSSAEGMSPNSNTESNTANNSTISSLNWSNVALLGMAAALGAATTFSSTRSTAYRRRKRLPDVILLVRHGESEGNADNTLYREKPDNLVRLTPLGIEQARKAGQRIEKILQEYNLQRLHLIVSPFERTLQTAMEIRKSFEHRIVRTDLQPRIREQEFGNLQNTHFDEFRNEQKRVGRFWYRFPTGESGADVYDRVKSWWSDTVLNLNEREGHARVDALVVVTHGLTMRFVLMGLYDWSPNTFHSVWNASNCDIYALKKNLRLPGMSPYVLDHKHGDVPRSSIAVLVEYQKGQNGESKTETFTLEDYLSIPAPRTTQCNMVRAMLQEQHEILRDATITHFSFVPFHEGAVIPGWLPDEIRASSENAEEVLKFPSYIRSQAAKRQ